MVTPRDQLQAVVLLYLFGWNWALGGHVQVQKQMRNVSVPVKVLQHLTMSMAALERPVTPLAAPALLLECLHGFTRVFPQ